MLRIIAGEFRGRRLKLPRPARGAAGAPPIRPTSAKVREAVFDILGARMSLDQCRFLDLCAGTGAVGLEALSRGAAEVEFVENDRAALLCLEENLALLGVAARVLVTKGDRPRGGDFNAAFADPPYRETARDFSPVVAALSPGGWLMFECAAPPPPPPGCEAVRTYRYGRTRLELWRKAEAPA